LFSIEEKADALANKNVQKSDNNHPKRSMVKYPFNENETLTNLATT